MSRYIFIYGTAAGLLTIVTMMLGLLAGGSDSVAGGEVFGYLVMLVALSLIFVAIKRYRDLELGGVITFGRAVLLGMGIAAVAGVAYVIVWEIYLARTDYAFIDQYAAAMIEAARASGEDPEAIAALEQDMATMKTRYANPLHRVPMTFLEIFPVGALVSLLAAALLKNPRVLPA